MRISDWSSDVCSSDLAERRQGEGQGEALASPTRRARPAPASFPGLRNTSRLTRPNGPDRKSVVQGTSVSVRVDLGGLRIIKKKNTHYTPRSNQIFSTTLSSMSLFIIATIFIH